MASISIRTKMVFVLIISNHVRTPVPLCALKPHVRIDFA